ncbi:MAG: transposase, partial [Paludibacter sp.]|nr:transposase [Paludibacter sp.]
YLNRIRSSRKLETEAGRNLELMWLLRKLKPDFKTIADFRKDNEKAIKNVFKQFNMLCKEWELFGCEVIAVDGSKFGASNSKRNNFSKKKVKQHLNYIDEKISIYLNELDNSDEEETDTHVPSVDEINKRIEELEERKAK